MRLQGSQEVNYRLLIGLAKSVEICNHAARLGGRNLAGCDGTRAGAVILNGLNNVRLPSVVQEKESLPDSPKWSSAELVRTGPSRGDAISQEHPPGTHPYDAGQNRRTDGRWRGWRLYWANSKIGIMDPPQVGEFKDGRGEFFAQDTINGRVILIRYTWTDLTTSSPHFEQSFSDDGGKTWEVNLDYRPDTSQ